MSKKQITIAVWAFVFGQDTKIKTIRGTVDEAVDTLQGLCPVKGISLAIRKAMGEAVFTQDIHWVGGHQMGIEVLSIKRIKEDQDIHAPHPVEETDEEALAALDPSTRMCIDPYSVVGDHDHLA